jgi:hypothetical protein
MATGASDTDELPCFDDQLLQARNILTLCTKLSETSLEPEEFDLTYPLMATVSLLEDAAPNDEEIIQASSILKAVTVTLANKGNIGACDFDPSYPLDVAIDLIDEVLDDLAKEAGKKRHRPKKAMREISKVDPDHARAFHRLLSGAGKLPLAELERLARYAEIELTDARARTNGAPKATAPTEPAAAGESN